MLETESKKLTLEEFLLLPETEPASEYIDGKVIQKPIPQLKHSRIQGNLVSAINAVAESSKVALAFPELRCTFGGRSIVPDVVVLEWNRIPINASGELEDTFRSYPDWIIEVLSPKQDQTTIIRKIGSLGDPGVNCSPCYKTLDDGLRRSDHLFLRVKAYRRLTHPTKFDRFLESP